MSFILQRGAAGEGGMGFRWLLFNLFTQHGPVPQHFYFSGRMYVVARMLLAMELAIKDWESMSVAEKTVASVAAATAQFQGGMDGSATST